MIWILIIISNLLIIVSKAPVTTQKPFSQEPLQNRHVGETLGSADYVLENQEPLEIQKHYL